MPPIPKGAWPTAQAKPRRTKGRPPPSREAQLRSALAGLLRRLGKIGLVVPTDSGLIALAENFTQGGLALADDQGKPVDLALAPPNPEVDDHLPF